MTRRALLGLGGLGALALALGARRARAGGPSNLLVVWNAGGWDPTFVFDPHPEHPGIAGDEAASVAEVGGIRFADAESRPSVRAFFEAWAERAVVVNGLSVGSISHEGCTRLALTGGRALGGPDLATILASETGAALAMPHVVLSGPRYPGALGAALVPLNATLAGIATGALPAGVEADAQAEASIRAYLSSEADRLGASAGGPLGDWLTGMERLPALERAIAALEVPEDPTEDARLALAVRVLQSGLCRSLTVDAGLPAQTTWDSHHANAENQDRAFEQLFERLNTLLAALDAAEAGSGRSLLDQTLVMVLSEMGRAPVLNAAEGKDHWPYTSALLVGAGLGGGRTLGGTDASLAAMPVDLASGAPAEGGARLGTAELLAGVLGLFEVDPGPWFPETTPLGGLA